MCTCVAAAVAAATSAPAVTLCSTMHADIRATYVGLYVQSHLDRTCATPTRNRIQHTHTHTHLRSPCIYVRKHINGHAWLRDSKRTRSAKDTAQCTCAYLNTRTRVCSVLIEDAVTHALSDSRGTKEEEEEEKEAPGGGMSVRMRFRCSAMSC